MTLTVSLALPAEAASVRVARHVVAGLLDAVGASADAVSDVCVALSEACANVVKHAQAVAEYQVVAEVHGDVCQLTVTDRGRGFRPSLFGRDGNPPTAPEMPELERGRGIHLIRSLTDRVGISSGPGEGVIIFLEKRLGRRVSLSGGKAGTPAH